MVLFVMGLEATPLWSTIESVVRQEGVELFDIDLPSDTRRGGALRVFITRVVIGGPTIAGVKVDAGTVPESQEDASEAGEVSRVGISFEDCVRVSKRILDLDEQQELIPGNCTLEVSSPGINRKLRLPEHFKGALGERIKVKFRSPESGATVVMNGTVRGASDQLVLVEGEGKKEMVSIPLSEIKEARVDFKF
jgi:ribosome maturation factor RimP